MRMTFSFVIEMRMTFSFVIEMRMTFSCVGKMRKAFSCGENKNGIRMIGNGVFTIEISVSCEFVRVRITTFKDRSIL